MGRRLIPAFLFIAVVAVAGCSAAGAASSGSDQAVSASPPAAASVAGGSTAAAPATTSPAAKPDGAGISGQTPDRSSIPDPACGVLASDELDGIMGSGHGPIHFEVLSKGTCSVEAGDRSAAIELQCGKAGSAQWEDYGPPNGKLVAGARHVYTAPTFDYFVRLHDVSGRGECTLSGSPATNIKAVLEAAQQGKSDSEARAAGVVAGSTEALIAALDRAYEEAA